MKLIPNLPIGSILKRLKFRKPSAEQSVGSQEASLEEESKIKKLIPKPSIGGIVNRLKSKIPLLKQKPEPETPSQRPPPQPTTPPQRPPPQPATPPQRPPTGQAPPPPAAYEAMPEPMSEEGSRIAKLIPKPSIGGIVNRLKFKRPSFGKKSASELFEPQAEAQPKKRFGITKKKTRNYSSDINFGCSSGYRPNPIRYKHTRNYWRYHSAISKFVKPNANC